MLFLFLRYAGRQEIKLKTTAPQFLAGSRHLNVDNVGSKTEQYFNLVK